MYTTRPTPRPPLPLSENLPPLPVLPPGLSTLLRPSPFPLDLKRSTRSTFTTAPPTAPLPRAPLQLLTANTTNSSRLSKEREINNPPPPPPPARSSPLHSTTTEGEGEGKKREEGEEASTTTPSWLSTVRNDLWSSLKRRERERERERQVGWGESGGTRKSARFENDGRLVEKVEVVDESPLVRGGGGGGGGGGAGLRMSTPVAELQKDGLKPRRRRKKKKKENILHQFTTKGLEPITHRLKTLDWSISLLATTSTYPLSGPELLLDLRSTSSSNCAILISPSGDTISLFTYLPPSPSPLILRTPTSTFSFSPSSLPKEVHQAYHIASKFITELKRRTTIATYYTPYHSPSSSSPPLRIKISIHLTPSTYTISLPSSSPHYPTTTTKIHITPSSALLPRTRISLPLAKGQEEERALPSRERELLRFGLGERGRVEDVWRVVSGEVRRGRGEVENDGLTAGTGDVRATREVVEMNQ